MMDRPHPVGVRQIAALIVRDGDERHVVEGGVERCEIRQIEPAVKRRHGAASQFAKNREMEQVDVEMQHVESDALRPT